jgi:hypothetical protein
MSCTHVMQPVANERSIDTFNCSIYR